MTIQGQSRGRQGQWVHYVRVIFDFIINLELDAVSLREIIFDLISHFYLTSIPGSM